jgi:hypothetical protein
MRRALGGAALLLGGLAVGCLRMGDTLESVGAETAAPQIAGTDAKDQPFQLSDFRGKVVLLDFWRSN